MAHFTSHRWLRPLLLGGLFGLLGALPGLAQAANFDSITLGASTPRAQAEGFTAGFFPLSNVAMRDSQGRVCAGFADTNPDHLLILDQDLDTLTLQVNSGGNDTTLLVIGPDNRTIRCGEDTSRRNPDARIQDRNWPAGTYQVWVGAHNQGQRHNYTLIVGQQRRQ